MTLPTVSTLKPLFLRSLTEITGEVSVKYPSITGISAAAKCELIGFCSAALQKPLVQDYLLNLLSIY
jgi:hypothetical protein